MVSPDALAARVTSCPNCGGQVEFKAGTSLLSVCVYCSSVVARVGGDVSELEILGKVAPLAELGSPLALGTSGRYRKKSFTLVGRAQLDYGMGPWNEWYAVFDDGRWGWLAEAQGRVYLTFGGAVAGLPTYGQAKVGARFSAGKLQLTVVERRRARFVAGEGELPFSIAPGDSFNYCDVQGPGGVFGTIDYGKGNAPEALFLGEELTYADLFDKSVVSDVASAEAGGGVGMNCPNCGSAVALRAPDDAQRVTCGACEALLDCGKGNELYLLEAAKRRGPEPQIPLGSVGRFDGDKYVVYGHLVRSVTFDGVQYTWQEYLIRNEKKGGYRWLVDSEGHWSFIHPVHAGDVEQSSRSAKIGDLKFRHFQSASARVEHLRGEFYWKVAVGERAGTMDYISPPFVLSREMSADEVNWSMGRYLDTSEVEAAFGLKKALRSARGVAPHEPNRIRPGLISMAKLGVIFTAALFLLAAFMGVTSDNRAVLEQEWPVTATPVAPGKPPQFNKEIGPPVRSQEFELDERTNVAIVVQSDVAAAWLFVDGKMIDQTSYRTVPFGAQITPSSDPATAPSSGWTRVRERVVHLGELSAGKWALELTPEWGTNGAPPTRFAVIVRQDTFIMSHAIFVFIMLWLLPVIQAFRYYGFEKRRWAESDYAG